MARRSAWVLTLVLACAPAVGAMPLHGTAQNRAQRPQQGERKDVKDKAQPASAATKPDDRERWKWWLYDRAELAITDQQSQEINQIFESTIHKLRDAREQLDRAEHELSTTIKEVKADVATVSLLLDRVESARTQHNKLRTIMLYRMHLVLSADQRAKLQVLRERWERERRERDRSRETQEAVKRQF